MSDLLDQILTPEVRMVLYLIVMCIVMVYILSIVYVTRDAQRRGAEPWWVWSLVAVVPIVGLLTYVILRPSSYLIDREEQDLDIALREHQLSHYGICPKCGAPIDRDFVVCPLCNTQVRNVCPTCHRPLNADWKVCPYCRTRIQSQQTSYFLLYVLNRFDRFKCLIFKFLSKTLNCISSLMHK